jgi:hypothetical protein
MYIDLLRYERGSCGRGVSERIEGMMGVPVEETCLANALVDVKNLFGDGSGSKRTGAAHNNDLGIYALVVAKSRRVFTCPRVYKRSLLHLRIHSRGGNGGRGEKGGSAATGETKKRE